MFIVYSNGENFMNHYTKRNKFYMIKTKIWEVEIKILFFKYCDAFCLFFVCFFYVYSFYKFNYINLII